MVDHTHDISIPLTGHSLPFLVPLLFFLVILKEAQDVHDQCKLQWQMSHWLQMFEESSAPSKPDAFQRNYHRS